MTILSHSCRKQKIYHRVFIVRTCLVPLYRRSPVDRPKREIATKPTGNLDLATQDDIMAIFKNLAHNENKCVTIVTHSPEVAAQSDEVFHLAPLRER